ncbi:MULTISPECIES: GntR family transcriptional regulator [Catenuloplanes]|uniref:DNA-binding GntR family transcriptional regulator n=1 Tax=Catenuloplanes niger TaxID=587534 RepID=A0AAE4CQB0_9ACTN|nr:GntR family transcriptional regulator [Catenuloplanes niger]MDR7320307.1 DNA-binding GntR family transcriptional regulator [Catenuloplanes niger]
MTSLRDCAYAELRRRIVDLVYPPGQRLFERDLATELSVSRIPLREALQQLRTDGLVVCVPRQGVVVAHFTAGDVRDLFDVRESLESLAARLAADRADAAGLAGLRASMAAARAALAVGDDPGIAAANARFHRELVALAANPLLSAMMRSLDARTQWLFNLTRRRDPVRQCDEHRGLYEAIAAGAAERAAALAFAHVASGRAESMALAAEWSAGAVDPVEATRSRRRVTEPAGSTPAVPPA